MKNQYFDLFDKFFNKIAKEANQPKNNQVISFCQKIDLIGSKHLARLSEANSSNTLYWNTPNNNYAFLAFEQLLQIQGNQGSKSKELENQTKEIAASFMPNYNQKEFSFIPMVVGGIKFYENNKHSIWQDFNDFDWFIPKFIIVTKDESSYFVYNFLLNDNKNDLMDDFKTGINFLFSTPYNNQIKPAVTQNIITDSKKEKEKWINNVNTALGMISKNKFEKIVLSRFIESELSDVPDTTRLLNDLAGKYPKCYIFSLKSGNSVFFGASPERLAKISNGVIEADALAGSIPRGNNVEEDTALANQLLSSKKNLLEQEKVLHFILESFSNIATDIEYNPKPTIRKLENIQHLWTPIKAKLKPGITVFDIIDGIHPTPAICGVPWSSAMTTIKALESYNRGLYAGVIGWFNFNNEGEFAVGIRSALLNQNKLYAFAGCGIVNGSDPEVEFQETELKLKPILSLFKNENIYQS